ncbi:MAG: zf-HC2 domain-containing protein [Planctomycetes bacterium]|nr:zf-HC2 domain-containing protein [Planctomycetota bacterium]
MKCDEAIDLLSEYMDDELDAEQRKEVEAHVMACAKCRRELDTLRATVTLVGSLSEVKAPDAFAADVSKTLEEEERGKIIWPSARVVGSLLAAAAVLLVVSVTFMMQRPAPMEFMAPKKPAAPKIASREVAEAAREEEAPVADKAEDREADHYQYADKVRIHRRATETQAAKDAKESRAAKTVSLVEAKSKPVATPAKKAAPAPRPMPPAKAPKTPVVAEGLQLKKAGGKPADRDRTEVGRLEETKKPEKTAPGRDLAKARAGAELRNEALTRSRAPAGARVETPIAKRKESRFAARSRLAPAEAQTAPAPPAAAAKAEKAAGEGTRGPGPQAEARTLVIRSRNPQADMTRVQSLLRDKYPPPTVGEVAAGRLDASIQQAEPARCLQTTIAANRLDALLGDLKRLHLTVTPQWDERGRTAGLLKQQKFARKLDQAAQAPEAIHITILFQQVE